MVVSVGVAVWVTVRRARQHRGDLGGLPDRQRFPPHRRGERPDDGLHLPPRSRPRRRRLRRSLVSRGGLTAAEVRAGAMGNTVTGTGVPPVVEPPAEPSLVATGVRFARPGFRGLPVADTKTRLVLRLTQGAAKLLPVDAEVSVRWDPLVLDAPVEGRNPGRTPRPPRPTPATPGPRRRPALGLALARRLAVPGDADRRAPGRPRRRRAARLRRGAGQAPGAARAASPST